ncbi:MAG: hypothetical protein GY742_13940 [Hyphomicrobiales bacterium]|nr:hypothetical protein [Hyphomicrobiales bacterium]
MAYTLQHFSGGISERVLEALTRKSDPVEWTIRIVTVLIPIVFLAIIILQPWVEPKWMFLDPLTAAQLSGDCCHSHYGFVSTLGVMLWVTTSAICIFSALLLLAMKISDTLLKFSLSAGILTGWLALDDAFLLHETVLPSFGITQNAVLAVYVILALSYLITSWRVILASDFWLLFVGGGALVVSLAVDTIFHSLNPMLVLLEDSAKFFGIFCWASFHITTLARILVYPNQTNLELRR